MSIIFPLFGTGTPQGTTDGYFREGSNLKRIKSESFQIGTIFTNVNGFFVDRKENLYVSTTDGNIRKYVKNLRTGNFDFLAWTISGRFSGGSTLSSNINSYPFISDFQNVGVDSQFNFYFRDGRDGNKLKKYSASGQLITSTSSDIGAFAVNKDNVISFIGNTVTKRDLNGNSISSFTVTGDVVAVNSDRVFSFDDDDERFDQDTYRNEIMIFFAKLYSYDLTGNLVWSIDRLNDKYFDTVRDNFRYAYYRFISLKNGNLFVSVYSSRILFQGYMVVNSNGAIRYITDNLRVTGTINTERNGPFSSYHSFTDPTSFNRYLYTQGANSDRSRLNF